MTNQFLEDFNKYTSVEKFHCCQDGIEEKEKCEVQCNHCKEYYKPTEQQIEKEYT